MIIKNMAPNPAADDNKEAEKVCKGSCTTLKNKCGKMLQCGDEKFNVTKHCPSTCAKGNMYLLCIIIEPSPFGFLKYLKKIK